jgi:ABC-2 type transport system permease protein
LYSLLRKEINSFLNSLIGYVVIFVFLLSLSLFMWVFPGDNNVFDSGFAAIDSLFVITPWLYLFLVPAITMRLLAEERKAGTIELLLTKPLTELQVVVAKYVAGFVLVLFSLIPTLLYYLCIYRLSAPPGNVDSGAIWGSYIGLLLLGSGFVAIGLFASSLTDNQVISFVVGLVLCFVCYTGLESLALLLRMGPASDLLYGLGISSHYASMSRGVIDTRDVVYFLSLITVFLFLTKLKLESRKW